MGQANGRLKLSRKGVQIEKGGLDRDGPFSVCRARGPYFRSVFRPFQLVRGEPRQRGPAKPGPFFVPLCGPVGEDGGREGAGDGGGQAGHVCPCGGIDRADTLCTGRTLWAYVNPSRYSNVCYSYINIAIFYI